MLDKYGSLDKIIEKDNFKLIEKFIFARGRLSNIWQNQLVLL